jgi:hypothetical protein
VAVMVRTGEKSAFKPVGRIGALPVTIITVIVSPMTRPIPNITAVSTRRASGGQRRAPDGLPGGSAQRQRGFAIRARHRIERIFCHRNDGRDGSPAEQDRTGKSGQTGWQIKRSPKKRRQHQDTNKTQHNRRQTRQHFDQRLEDLFCPGGCDFGYEYSRANAQWDGKDRGANGDRQRAEDQGKQAVKPFDGVPELPK